MADPINLKLTELPPANPLQLADQLYVVQDQAGEPTSLRTTVQDLQDTIAIPGPAGPQGPQGDPGAQGPQGPAGTMPLADTYPDQVTPLDADRMTLGSSANGFAWRSLLFSNLATWIRDKLGPLVASTGLLSVPADTDQLMLTNSGNAHSTQKLSWLSLVQNVFARLGGQVLGAPNKSTLVDNDLAMVADSAAGYQTKHVTWGQMWSNWLKAKTDALYALKASAQSITGNWTFASDPKVGNPLGYALLGIFDADGAVDSKNWALVADAGQLDIRVYDDAWNDVGPGSVLTLYRTGKVAQSIEARGVVRVIPNGTAAAPALQIGPGDAGGKTGMFWDPTAPGILTFAVNGRPQVGIFHNTDVNRLDVLPTWNLAGSGSKLLVGRNFNGTGAAGTLTLVSRTGDAYVMWVEAGVLRIGGAAPTVDGSVSHTSGIPVGSQVLGADVEALLTRMAALEARVAALEMGS